MSAPAAVLAVILAASLVLLLWRKLRGGASCCGEHEAPVGRVRPVDPDPAHYPYRYTLSVGGMVCANCARRVENTFHRTGRMLAAADLGRKELCVRSMDALDRQEAARLVDAAGYTLMDFKEKR